MDKDKIIDQRFSDKKGITFTSANHLANVAKEMIEGVDGKYKNISFINEDLSSLTSNRNILVVKGVDNQDLDTIRKGIVLKCKLTSFIAYIRETIKLKDKMIEDINDDRIYNWSGYREIKRPEMIEYTEDDIVNSWNIADVSKYYSLHAKASVIGKEIHNDGRIDKARSEYYTKLCNKTEVQNNASDTLIYTYSESLDNESVESFYMSLQGKHREIMKEYNFILSKIKTELDSLLKEERLRFELATDDFNEQVRKQMVDYAEYKKEEIQKINSLKIVIPQSLTEIFNVIKS